MLEPGWKLGAVGLNDGPFVEKLNSDFERIEPPNPEGLKAGALALNVDFGVAFAAGVEVAELLNILGTNGFALSGCKPKLDDEKIAGLKVALGLAVGLNSFASTFNPENDNTDEWPVEVGLVADVLGLNVGSFSH
jgi:hypothetical protein